MGEDGWEYEADQRHAEMIIEMLKLREAKATATPGEDENRDDMEGNDVPLEGEKATFFRSLAASLSYLSADRPDLMYIVKDREMATPTVRGMEMLKRMGRCLVGRPRAVLMYPWQGREAEVRGYTDSDWAGCRRAGKSTSGGALMKGTHFLTGWARTQNCVTLSSAEAELVAMTKLTFIQIFSSPTPRVQLSTIC